MAVVSPAARARVLRAICQDGPIVVSGDSMEPTLLTGDRIDVNVEPRPTVGDVIVFVDDENQTVVHRLVAHYRSTFVCLGDNRRALDPPIEAASVVGVADAVVVGAVRRPLKPTTRFARLTLLRRAVLGVVYLFLLRFRHRKNTAAAHTNSEVRDVAI